MVCLDTSFIIDVLRGDQKAKKTTDALIANNETTSIATPTLMELQTSLTLNSRGVREYNLIDKIIASSVILPLDSKSATRAGEIEARLILSGEMIPPIDIMIAAIALQNKEAVLTRNVKHLARIPGLEVRTY